MPIIPVHLDRLWGSIFSFEGGKFFWKWPKQIPYRVTVSFGAPLPANTSAQAVRQAIQELSADATAHRKQPGDLLDRRMIRMARRNWKHFAMADSTGRTLTYGEMLTGAVLVSRALPNDEMVGVLLPSTVGGALVNLGLTLRGVVPVNLNFTAGREAMKGGGGAVRNPHCRSRHECSSRNCRQGMRTGSATFSTWRISSSARPLSTKCARCLAARLAPVALLSRGGRTPDSPAGIIFSSGSTGVPKGVVLSHYNLISEIEAIAQLFWIGSNDRIAGVLPFFHSFGFTVTIWFPLLSGCGVVYHPNPTEAKAVGDLVQKHKATLLLSTPTFCSTYTRKCTPEQFASLRYVLVGAEKFRQPVADAFREKFGVELLEGYGCTEMSPVIAVNAPNFDRGKDSQTGNKAGQRGPPAAGSGRAHRRPGDVRAAAAEHRGPAAGERQQPNARLSQPAGADRGGLPRRLVHHWRHRAAGRRRLSPDYRPPLALQQDRRRNGAAHPRGRRAAEACWAMLRAWSPASRTNSAASAWWCSTCTPAVTPAELWQQLAESDMPRLWLPKRENIYRVEELPQLGTGKLDLRAVKARAQEMSVERLENSGTVLVF